MVPLSFSRQQDRRSIVNAMADYQAMLDAIRIGVVNPKLAECPDDIQERVDHLKAFGYFSDATIIGVCELPDEAKLAKPIRNPGIDRLAEDLQTKQTTTLSSGIDVIMADLKESMAVAPSSIDGHSHAMVFLYESPRDPDPDEDGSAWIQDALSERSALRANETATVLANYLRVLGFQARSHSISTSDIDLNKLAVASGLAAIEDGQLVAPFVGRRFSLAALTTNFAMAVDNPLADQVLSKTRRKALYSGRRFVDGLYPFEKLKRVDKPTTFIDEDRVPRVPKRADMFARSLFGDLGKGPQENARNGKYVLKAPTSASQRRALGAFILLQDGEQATDIAAFATDPETNAANVKAAAYFLGCDAVGISRCPDWTWYSHNAVGEEVTPPHDQAISIIIDQGYETMEGASGDDWISCAQSMRAYLRFSLLGGVLAKHIRNLGYSAKAHTVVDGDVLQPPLLLLSGLGEVSRIGEVILNPFMGPRLKSGIVTTTMPLAHDKPIDFGMQTFCESCNKCARECPSGAITAGPKLMFNGYEIWKSDSQRCTTYRIGTEGGAMCGRCMKTCPWNLEGLFAEAPFRWAAMNMPKAAPFLAKLDDMVGNGGLNLVKKWWWDLEMQTDGRFRPTEKEVNARDLQKGLNLKYANQTLAVYPAHLAPHPWPFPFLMDREKGIEAYQTMITAEEYKLRLSRGETEDLAHEYNIPGDDSPVVRVEISKAEAMTEDVIKYELRAIDGSDLPEWTAGAHIDIVVAPEFLRQYSMSGNPANRSCYQIAVLREDEGKGGSKLMHRIFSEGRKIFISKPINHFPLDKTASKSFLMGGGIGITPMIAMAHRLHVLGEEFEFHYSAKSRKTAGFIHDLENVPWKDKVHFHFTDEGTRADLSTVIGPFEKDRHIYTCGPDAYMNAVIEAANGRDYPEENRHIEYFSVPELPDYENNDFTLKLAKSGKEFVVPADQAITDVLNENGYSIDVKCSDGICGVCQCRLISGDVEHRDFVLSNKQRQKTIILCQSRAKDADGEIEIDL